MRLTDFFNFNDLVRVILIGSALLFFMGGAYGVFLHAMYSSQVDTVRSDLGYIGDLMKVKSSTAYRQASGEEARMLKEVSANALEYSTKVQAPPVTPYAYTYLNYWIASAAFTELTLNPKILGLPDDTVEVFNTLDSSAVFGQSGWWGREEFRGYDANSGEYRIFLGERPRLQTHFWSFYIFVFLISLFTIMATVKEEYELPIVPEIIYGIFLPMPFFLIYFLAALLSLIGLLPFLDPTQVDMFVLLLSFVIMSVISAAAAMVAGLVRSRRKKDD